MEKKEPHLGTNDNQTPSWMTRKTSSPLTYWNIVWAVCTGILFASAIEKMADALMIWATLYITFDPAISQWLHRAH